MLLASLGPGTTIPPQRFKWFPLRISTGLCKGLDPPVSLITPMTALLRLIFTHHVSPLSSSNPSFPFPSPCPPDAAAVFSSTWTPSTLPPPFCPTSPLHFSFPYLASLFLPWTPLELRLAFFALPSFNSSFSSSSRKRGSRLKFASISFGPLRTPASPPSWFSISPLFVLSSVTPFFLY